MKLVIIIIILFSLVLLIPNHAEASYESVCKALWDSASDPLNRNSSEKYEECVKNYEKQDFWRGAGRWGVGLFLLIIIGGVGIIAFKNISKSKTTTYDASYSYSSVVRKGWTVDEKEQVRIRQDGKCAHCGKPPPRWEYHHADEDRSNNSVENCEGLCPNCHSVETHEG